MIISKLVICNMALAALGEDSIRDFDDGNKRARMCDVFYGVTRDYLLSQFDWPFARKQQKLTQMANPTDWSPEGTYEYALPADCFSPVNLWPEGSRQSWEIRGKSLYCPLDSTQGAVVVLIYTVHALDPTKYSTGYINLLALAMAVRMALPLTSDEPLAKALLQQYETEKREVWANNANQGNVFPMGNDSDPDYDSFVTGERNAKLY